MTNFIVENNCESLITNNPLSSTGTILNITTGEGSIFPSTFPYRLTIWDETNYSDPSDDSGMEIVECTGRTGDTLTIIRGKESTSGVSHAQDSCVAMLITAGLFNDPTYGILPRLSNKQSFTNLLENGDFESWSAGTNAAPDGWTLSAGTIARSTIHKIGTYSSGHTPVGTANNLNMNINDYVHYQGKTVTFGCWVYAVNTGKANITVADGITYTNSTYHTGGSIWQWLTATLVVAVGATSLSVRLYPDHTAGNTIAYFDGAILVEGSVCPAFSPKPMINPSLITSAPSDTGYNGEIRIYSTGGTRRLYISDGSNWKYQAIAT